MNAWVYDYETLLNCTVAVFQHYKDPSNSKVFVIHESRNDFEEFLDFLENCAENGEYHIGFNNLSFDAQITQALLNNRAKLSTLSSGVIAGKIYDKSQTLIGERDYGEYSGLTERSLSINQIDVFKINHWDNPNRKASLKWLQYTCDWKSVMEMPIHHAKRVTTKEEIEIIINYCKNDVEFTGVLYNKTLPMLQVRKVIKAKYKINCLNYSNTKLGSELLLKKYCESTGKKKWDVKHLSTKRDKIIIKDVIFDYIKFKSKEFNEVLEAYNNLIVTQTKGSFSKSIVFSGAKFFYKLGGIHQCIEPGIYKSDDEYLILDFDVGSLHPNIACQNGMYPAHLGPEFYQVYKDEIVDVRMAEKAKGKLGDKAIVDGFKEAANATFGNSNNEHSWLNDPSYTMQTTVNSQLLITMLVEAISLDLTDFQILQTNTDGCTIRLLKSEQDKYYAACEQWGKLTKLKLEFAQGETMVIWDVNSYLLIYPDKKPKMKGRMQFEDLDLHKNKSFLVIPKAIYEFFTNGIFPEEYLKTNRNIFDYCGGSRVNKDWGFVGTCMVQGKVIETPLQKVIRYYISNNGCKITKVNKNDGRKINIVAGPWLQNEYNEHFETEWENYDINYNFYLQQINKEIETIIKKKSNQLTLF